MRVAVRECRVLGYRVITRQACTFRVLWSVIASDGSEDARYTATDRMTKEAGLQIGLNHIHSADGGVTHFLADVPFVFGSPFFAAKKSKCRSIALHLQCRSTLMRRSYVAPGNPGV